jgi:hypothetical protein
MRRGAPLPLPNADEPAMPVGASGPMLSQRPPDPPPRPEPLRTEFEFELPRGYLDNAGVVHKRGAMRLATARDELLPFYDDKVKVNPNYLTVVLLARVITRLGPLTEDEIRYTTVENLFASDLAFLQDLYRRINTEGHSRAAVQCPACGERFTVDLAGGSQGEP